jgi:hypothetical protein
MEEKKVKGSWRGGGEDEAPLSERLLALNVKQ